MITLKPQTVNILTVFYFTHSEIKSQCPISLSFFSHYSSYIMSSSQVDIRVSPGEFHHIILFPPENSILYIMTPCDPVQCYAITSCVKFFKWLKLLNECLVLILQHSHSVLQTLDVLLLLPPTLTGRLPVLQQSDLPLPVTVQGHHLGSLHSSLKLPGAFIRRTAHTRGAQGRHGGDEAQTLTLIHKVSSLWPI